MKQMGYRIFPCGLRYLRICCVTFSHRPPSFVSDFFPGLFPPTLQDLIVDNFNGIIKPGDLPDGLQRLALPKWEQTHRTFEVGHATKSLFPHTLKVLVVCKISCLYIPFEVDLKSLTAQSCQTLQMDNCCSLLRLTTNKNTTYIGESLNMMLDTMYETNPTQILTLFTNKEKPCSLQEMEWIDPTFYYE
jgi:hypothetical protein